MAEAAETLTTRQEVFKISKIEDMKNELEEILIQEENCKFLTTRIEH